MKRGYEYLASAEKQRMDKILLGFAAPFVKVTELVVRSYVSEHFEDRMNPVFEQTRIGKAYQPFPVNKFLTLDPVTEEPINSQAARIRKLGLDELAQARNVTCGSMSVIGWRPLIPSEQEEFQDSLSPILRRRHDALVMHSLPGQISSYGIYSHIRTETDPNDPEIRAEMNLKDVIDASPINDISLLKSLVSHAVARRLQ